MQNVYFISGLGADRRVFQFLDLSFCNPIFVEWIKPLRGERIAEYARRMRAQIHDKEPVIVGLSFGGMIGIEIARQSAVKKLVLISSAKSAGEIPFYLRMMRYIPIHKLFPPPLLRWLNRFAYRLMGINDRHDKKIFQGMITETDDEIISWSVNEIVHWKNKQVIPQLVHIHGTADILLPYVFVKPDYTVKGGQHLMVMLKPRTISRLLREILAS